MLLGYSDNRLSAGPRSKRRSRLLLLVPCLGEPRRAGPAARAAASPWVPALNGTSAALLMFLNRNGAM
jgi:hypothetical protein